MISDDFDEEDPICRLQLPDGTVPGNNVEALNGWKSAYDALLRSWAELKDRYLALDNEHKRTMRDLTDERLAHEETMRRLAHYAAKFHHVIS